MRIMNWKLQNNSPFSEQYSSVLFTERGIISKVQPRRPHLLSAPLPAVSARHQIFTNASRMQIFSIKVEPAWFIFACGRLSWIVRWGEQRLANRGFRSVFLQYVSVTICVKIKVNVVHLLLSEINVLDIVFMVLQHG